MRVSFANMLFSLCAEVPGADVDKITGALSYRMGQRFFKGAVPYGGPCWPRDNRALAVFMDAVGVPSLMPRTIDQINAEHGQYLLRKVLSETQPGEAVGLLGLSYKPGTPVIERSFGIDLAGWLAAEGPPRHRLGSAGHGRGAQGARRPHRLCAERGTMPVAIERCHRHQPDEGVCCHRLVGGGEHAGARSLAVSDPLGNEKDRNLCGARPRQ